ncbi:MAG: aldehyde ferredoxin oxidoreductase C-terminal domain-containing protein [Chloroflexota bacterium]
MKDAAHLWGKDTNKTEDILHSELGDKAYRIACIGPSGESLSLIAAIINDKGRAAARSGVGAVMGSKRLKAIVLKGSQKVPVAYNARLEDIRKTFCANLQAGGFIQGLIKHGTCGSVSAQVISGAASAKNWSILGEQGMPTHAKLTGDNVIKYQARRYACKGCPVACGGIVNIAEGPYQVTEAHKPEYETLVAFGTQCFNDNVESVVKANDICNLFGLDTISAGETIAFAMECYERGLIKKEQLDGIELIWGNADAMLAVLGKMLQREGFGDVLAEGVRGKKNEVSPSPALSHQGRGKWIAPRKIL